LGLEVGGISTTGLNSRFGSIYAVVVTALELWSAFDGRFVELSVGVFGGSWDKMDD